MCFLAEHDRLSYGVKSFHQKVKKKKEAGQLQSEERPGDQYP